MEYRVSAMNIKKLRKQKKWSQKKLAFVCDVDRSTIIRYENQNRSFGIQNRIITKLCNALGTTANVIQGYKEV